MPEGGEVYNVASELNETVSGLYITRVNVLSRAKGKRLDEFPEGVEIESVSSRGKHIIFTFRRPGRKRRYHLLSRLGMTGHWGYDPDVNHLEMVLTLSKRRKKNGNITFTEKMKLCYSSPRPFGGNDISLCQEDYDDHFKNVGLCLLNDTEKITKKWWREQIQNPRIKNKNIASYLMEQKRFAGVGNYLKSEILFAAKIHPDRKLNQLTKEEIELLRVKTIKKITQSRDANGLTIATYKTPSGKKGTFVKKIYKAEDGEITYKGVRYNVKEGVFDTNRTTYYVPELQL